MNWPLFWHGVNELLQWLMLIAIYIKLDNLDWRTRRFGQRVWKTFQAAKIPTLDISSDAP